MLFRKKKGEGAQLQNGDEKIHGLNDIPAVKPFLPIKFIGNIPSFMPVKDVLKKAYGTGNALGWQRSPD